jgi:tetratricopeptide (TPR) repeat protein
VRKYFKYEIQGWQLRITFILILVALSSFNDIFSQKSQSAATRQSSIDAFSKGNYEQAYNAFSQLLLKYPKDPLYKYYSGVCLVKLKREPENAVTLLQQSLNGASVVKSLPPDGLFYLGRAQQMSGNFSEAIESFTLYTEQVGKKTAREQDVPGYIQECENKKGMITAAIISPARGDIVEKTEIIQPGNQPSLNDAAKKPTEKEISDRKELPSDYESILDEALKFQYRADSLNLLAGEQKKQLDKLPESERSSLKIKISQNEILAVSYQKSADMKYNEAQAKMTPKHEKAPQKGDSVQLVGKTEPVKVEENKSASKTTGQTDTVKKEAPVSRRPAEIYSFFEILPKEAAYPNEKIKIDPEVTTGLIYSIQLAVFRNPVAPSFFKGINPVFGLRVPGTDKTNYYAGMFRRSSDAKKALLSVKETGFRDAFIVALLANKPISTDRAALLENEWGMKSLVDITQPGASIDTIPPTLAFRVEVARSLKPLKADAVEALRTMAGSRGLDIIHLSDGNIVYLIGKFITFESAAEYADLLIRNNYRGAKVVAWLGKKEVPVDTARQLFNDLE